MQFTGERLIPEQERADDLYDEHVVRYLFASQFARGRRVLDAGCGAGYGSAMLADAAASSVLGADIAEVALAYARQRYQRPGLSFAALDLAHSGLPPASFDLIVSLEVIEHLADPASFVQAAAALLTADGLLVVSTPNPATYPAGNPFHKHEMAVDDFAALLQDSLPALALFEQDYTTALTLRPSPRAAQHSRGAEQWTPTPAAQRPPREPDYYLAVCARQAATLDSALSTAKSIMYELPADRLQERIAAAQTLQRLLDDKNRQVTAKDEHIAHLEAEYRRQSEWAAGMEQQLADLRKRWFVRLFGRRLR